MPNGRANAAPDIEIVAADDVIDGLETALGSSPGDAIGIAGLAAAPYRIGKRLTDLLPRARPADAIIFEPARRKIDTELAYAREATRIAELGFQRLLELARPGMSEDELASELRWHSKSLGAEDNFVLLCAGPHNKAVAPSNGRRMKKGDIIVCELTPSYRGQLAQICRTIVLGEAPALLREKYDLVATRHESGLRRGTAGRRDGRRLRAPSTRCWRQKATANSVTRRISGAAATVSVLARSGRATSRSTTRSCSSPTCCS